MHVRARTTITRHPITPAASYLRHPRNLTYPPGQPYPVGPTTVDVVTWVPNDATTPLPPPPSSGGSSGSSGSGAVRASSQATARGEWRHAVPGRSPRMPPIEPLSVVGVKVDAEGYDVAVAAGLSEVLARGRVPFVLLDFHPRQAAEVAGCDGVRFVKWMVAHGYVSTSLRDEVTHTPLNLAAPGVVEGVVGRMHAAGGSHHMLFSHGSFHLDAALRRVW
jgi:hypothetical protein